MRVGIIGTGAYGLALANTIHNNNHDIIMWTKFVEEKEMLDKKRIHEKVLPNVKISDEIKFTCDLKEVLVNSNLIILAVPAPFIGEISRNIKDYITYQHIVIAAKGIENETCLFLNDVVEKFIKTDKLAVLSGPSFAVDIFDKMPIGLTIASHNQDTINITKKALSNDYFKLRETNDVIGTEVCGSIKNVIAIASGMLDALGANESTKAMFITESLHDIKEIIAVLGGDEKTILSFAGIGDLLLTCTTPKSRNYSFGYTLVNNTKKEIDEYIKNHTIEGLYTLKSIHQLLESKNVSIPIIDLIYDIVFKHEDAKELLRFLIEKS
ncbi:MAG: NAD(P)H-dependent glycerol-3-phosphate dehydrogenase [Lactobacillales bacterium]|nr:NAD(P)H-dependent glycerol-3-phosphate dehydrogenase [Lactobacillales bacterium]